MSTETHDAHDALTAAFAHSLQFDARPMSTAGEAEHFTKVALAALADNFAVVKLPAPAGMDEDGQIWFDTTEMSVDTTGSEPEIYAIGRRRRTVKQLREEAAELLSIAALVDAINAATEGENP